MSEVMSVTRALAEIKILDDRIVTANTATFCAIEQGDSIVNSRLTKEQAAVEFGASLQRSMDLIDRRLKLKAAVVTSNAQTEVIIVGEKMSVAEAIERKANAYRTVQLIESLFVQLNKNRVLVNKNNVEVQQRVDSLITTVLGKERKASDEEIRAIAEPYERKHKQEVFDPLDLEKVIGKLKTSHENFMLNVDFVLSESNATTKVTV